METLPLANLNKRNFLEYAGGSGGFMDKYGYPFCRGRIFDTDEEDKGQYNDTREIFWATGACFLVKASAFHEVGGFDASFFAHMEEIDLCWRLKNKGYSIYAMPKSVVYHVGGGTLQKTNPRKTFLNFRNNLCTITKNNTSAFWWLIILYRLLLDGAAGLKFLAGGQASLFFQVIKAHFAYYARIPGLLKQRSKLNKTRKSNLTGVYKGSLVFSYYLRRRKYFNDLTSILFT
jgi:GT2 family glycosyltransferase